MKIRKLITIIFLTGFLGLVLAIFGFLSNLNLFGGIKPFAFIHFEPTSTTSKAIRGISTEPNTIEIVSRRKSNILKVQITEDSIDKIRGLSGTKELREGYGMLFVTKPAARVEFWMRDMHFPIDLIHIHDGEVVETLVTLEPCKDLVCPKYKSSTLVDYSLEVNAGYVEEKGIFPGDKVRVNLLKQ